MGRSGMNLVVDDRYAGHHGIARYATEVISRFAMPYAPLGGPYRPGKARDTLNLRRARLSASDVLYNPGYTAGPSRCVQVVTVHDLIHLRKSGLNGKLVKEYYERVVRPAVRNARHVITVSETSRGEIARWLANEDVTIHNAGNGCSTAFSSVGHRFDAGAPYVVYVGNLKEHKNPNLAFEAMRRLPDFKFVVVSSDSKHVLQLADKFGLLGRTIPLGGLTDASLAEVYRGASALAFPSIVEGFGLPVVEAMRCGTPVVYYEGCESVHEIARGDYAVSTKSDAVEFASMLMYAAEKGAGPVALASSYDWNDVAQNVQAVLADVVSER